MKNIAIAVSTLTIVAVVGLGPAQAKDDQQPSKVQGAGVYQHFVYPGTGPEWYPSDEEEGSFEVNINPSGRAVIYVDGPKLREFWGGPMALEKEKADYFYTLDFGTATVGQAFGFNGHSRNGELVTVWVFVHDNVTPGYNDDDPMFSDWFGIWIEGSGGNGLPDGLASGGADDDLFTGMGIVTDGDIIDHRK